MAGVPLGLGPVVDATVSKVVARATEQFNLAWGWKADLKKFSRIMKMLRSVLQDADEKNAIGTHSHLRSWLLELRDIADEAEDVLEEVSYEHLRRRVADQIPKWKKVSYFFSRSNPLVFRLRMANKVKSLNLDLADINDWATRLGLQYKLATTGFEPVVDPQQTTSFLPSLVIGRDEDVSEIESLLLNSTSSQEQELPVIAIVGMPGLGKTTLAKKVSKTEKILEKFGEHVIWVSVSTNFENKLILKEMHRSITNDASEGSAEIAIKEIQKKLEEKCYLLILDDVWNEEKKKWKDLQSYLLGINKNKGNRVLVTTRSESVAVIVATNTKKHIIRLGKLTDDECWAVIKDRAFGRSSVPPNLMKVGKEISEKCKGVPLVASLIGATLQNRRNIDEWRSILQNHGWLSLERENGVLDIIRLSYDRLPELALKQCFAFCSVFPKDFDMEKEVLIQLWMAEGYLSSSEDCSVRMEGVGEKYYRYLLSYSLFQEENTYWGRVTCKMHDLIHDFAESISNSETAILDVESDNKLPSSIRHLNLIQNGGLLPANLGSAASNLRTLLSWKQDVAAANGGVQSDLRRLRVLSVHGATDAKQLSKCFGKSKSLRYLDISGGWGMKEFPKFIEMLYNMETLRFEYCEFQMPPEGLVNLINLRHIYFTDEERMPSNIGRLTNLQTLPLFFVGTSKGRKIEELGSLCRLTRSLDIHKLELVKGKSEAESAKLHEKLLDNLTLVWSSSEDRNDEYVLEGLRPHSSLKILAIECFGGKTLSSWMLKSGCGFSSLQKLFVWGCKELTEAEFAFPSLKEISIRDSPNLKEFRASSEQLVNLEICDCGVESVKLPTSKCLQSIAVWSCRMLRNFPDLSEFSLLRSLSILSNPNLEHLPSGLSSCTALESLTIQGCRSNLVSIPDELDRLRSLVRLEISFCPSLRCFPKEMLGSYTSLKTLEIGDFSNELEEFPGFESINNLSACLQNLTLRGWEKLTQLPHQIQALTSLKSLDMRSFGGVKALPEWLGQLSSLKSLAINYFSGMHVLPESLASCTGLESLSISSCFNLVSAPVELKELRSLVRLEIDDCQKMRSFPEEILGNLTCLKELRLGPFSEELEEFIGMSSIHHNLPASLEKLTLYGWEKLTQLPPSAETIKRLSKLAYFRTDWTELEEKIQQEKQSGSQNQ